MGRPGGTLGCRRLSYVTLDLSRTIGICASTGAVRARFVERVGFGIAETQRGAEPTDWYVTGTQFGGGPTDLPDGSINAATSGKGSPTTRDPPKAYEKPA